MNKIFLLIFVIGTVFISGCIMNKENSMPTNNFFNTLYPSIRPIGFITDFGEGILVYEKLNDELVIVLKTDVEKSEIPDNSTIPDSVQIGKGEEIPIIGLTRYVTTKDLEEYNISKQELIQKAIKNFENGQFQLQMAQSEEDSSKAYFITPQWDDSYKFGKDAVQAHLLAPSSIKLLQQYLSQEFYIRMSNYEDFVVFRKDISEKNWDVIKNITQEDFQNKPHPMSDRLFMYKDGKIIVVEDKYTS